MDESRKTCEPEPVAKSNQPERKSRPKIYFAACGALCDVFWWARRADESDPVED